MVDTISSIEDQKHLAKLFAEMFIARPTVKAFQNPDGSYNPDRTPITMANLVDHIAGRRTMGHYLVNPDNTVKLFAFDLDLRKDGLLPSDSTDWNKFSGFTPGNPREHWRSREKGPARNMLRSQMLMLGHQLATAIKMELDIRTAVAYSGSKGIHVYGFTGPTTAELARKGAAIVLESTKNWQLERGKNLYRFFEQQYADDPNEHMYTFEQFSLEVYPKQDTLDDKDLGNLMRLPMGRNLQAPKDPAFFIDMRSSFTELYPRNPIETLTAPNLFA